MIRRIFNPSTQGGVAHDTEGRISDILDGISQQRGEVSYSTRRDLQASRADVYRQGETVSIERERARTLGMQEALDKEVTRENTHQDIPHKDGRPPCQRVRRERE